jgi:hypothetical protein
MIGAPGMDVGLRALDVIVQVIPEQVNLEPIG